MKTACTLNLNTTRASECLFELGICRITDENIYRYLSSCFRYHLKDVIVGKIYFLLVRIKIKHMEIAIIKRETTGSGLYFSMTPKYAKNRK